jgi:FtsZ-interacting cell division protein ZipA
MSVVLMLFIINKPPMDIRTIFIIIQGIIIVTQAFLIYGVWQMVKQSDQSRREMFKHYKGIKEELERANYMKANQGRS